MRFICLFLLVCGVASAAGKLAITVHDNGGTSNEVTVTQTSGGSLVVQRTYSAFQTGLRETVTLANGSYTVTYKLGSGGANTAGGAFTVTDRDVFVLSCRFSSETTKYVRPAFAVKEAEPCPEVVPGVGPGETVVSLKLMLFLCLTAGFIFGWYLLSPLEV